MPLRGRLTLIGLIALALMVAGFFELDFKVSVLIGALGLMCVTLLRSVEKIRASYQNFKARRFVERGLVPQAIGLLVGVVVLFYLVFPSSMYGLGRLMSMIVNWS